MSKKMNDPTPSTPQSHPDPRPDRRRDALRESLESVGMTPTEAARAAGLPTANAIFNFLNGRSKGLSQGTLERLAEVIPGATISSLSGVESPPEVPGNIRPIQVRAAVAAGLMQSAFDLPARAQKAVYLPIDETLYAVGVFGVEVREPGAERLYPVHSILACVPLHGFEGTLRNGHRLILQRISGGRVEVTVRELELQANEAWLWLRTSHPEHQQPVRMPFTPGHMPPPWRDGDRRYSVAAVVAGAYIPEL